MVEKTRTTTEKREIVYDAVLYGLGAALNDLTGSELGKRFAEEIHKSFGKYMIDYLESNDIRFETSDDPEELVTNVVTTFLEDLDFADPDLEVEPTEDRGNHAVWRNLLGNPAYEALEKVAQDPFLSCPLNAVLRYELNKLDHTLVVHGCSTDLSRNLLESWEEVRPQRHFL